VAAATTLHSPLVQAQQPPKAQTADDWKQKTGQTVTFKGSYGGPGTQSRALIAGLDADVVTLALSADVLKPAVLAIVLVAAWRVGCRALAVLRLPDPHGGGRSRCHGMVGGSLAAGAAGLGSWGAAASGPDGSLLLAGGAALLRQGLRRAGPGGNPTGTLQWTAIGLFQHNSHPPGTSEIRPDCWSRGPIISALLAVAQGGCHPSMEPPNPDAAQGRTSAHQPSTCTVTLITLWALGALDRLGEAEAAGPGAVAECAQQRCRCLRAFVHLGGGHALSAVQLLAELLLEPIELLERRKSPQGAQAGEG
jgi:hypothetical protein